MEVAVEEADLTPRDYQLQLTRIALERNSIIFLPTGTGKTFIATMVLRQMSKPLERPIREGGKISCVLVNTVTLVEQQSKHLRQFTHFSVGAYSGDMKVDLWSNALWLEEINKHQILVMTAQILLNLIEASILSLNSVNLLIFDECHRGVSDHCMRQIMIHFQNLTEPPRVIGLTATLLNKNCKPNDVYDLVKELETTFHSQIATVDELKAVLGYRTNPTENVRAFKKHLSSAVDCRAMEILDDLTDNLLKVKINSVPSAPTKGYLKLLQSDKGLKDVVNLIKDAKLHIEVLGTFGGQKAVLAHMIQIERLKKSADTKQMTLVYDTILTVFTLLLKLFSNEMKGCSESDKIFRFSSSQVLVMIQTIKEYKSVSHEALCGIIFVQRRFTAKVLYHILMHLRQHNAEFSYLKPNFMVGYNCNPYNDTRENMYNVKVNRKVIQDFSNKEIDLVVASNVLEEGVDIPTCTFVARFDKPVDYRSYIQSKGRARHRKSMFYMLIDIEEERSFRMQFANYQAVEKTLNDLFIGRNQRRRGPSRIDIEKLYNEHELPPYYTNGPGSAQVNMISAISLLCRYCNSLPQDNYTKYAPVWYADISDIALLEETENVKVVIEMPIICPLLEPIESGYFPTKKIAKRAAALKACELLHKAGELDDFLLPVRHNNIEESTNFLFQHWPEVKCKTDGNSKSLRTYAKHIPPVLNKQIRPNAIVHIHVITLTPLFTYDNPTTKMIYNLYNSSLCFGIITGNPLPDVCEFPLYVTPGEINVNIMINKTTTILTADQLHGLKEFHCLVFRDVIKVLKQFLLIDNSDNVDGMLIVPLSKLTNQIDFQIVDNHKVLYDQKLELKDQEKVNLVVTEETFLGKIVTPWYRQDDTVYVVTEVCSDLTAASEFPSDDFTTFSNYFKDKYRVRILKPHQPLLLVKALSKRLNCLKPRGAVVKRSRDKSYEEMEEHLVPELCVKQDFPADLWLQAKLLPSILHRLSSLLLAEELRTTIVRQAGLGADICPNNSTWRPLSLDMHLSKDLSEDKSKSKSKTQHEEVDVCVKLPEQEIMKLVQDFNSKRLEREYPWLDSEEPIDIERNLDVTLMDIQYYENFVTQMLTDDDHIIKNFTANKPLAITYDKHFVDKPIALLEPKGSIARLELVDVYKAIVSAKANEIVNLERSETLGDSFLKLSSTIFILFRFPKYEEGRATTLKSQLISNRNLFYAGTDRILSNYIKNSDFTPSYEWRPPYFCVPDSIKKKIDAKEMCSSSLFTFFISLEEQVNGILTKETEQQLDEIHDQVADDKHVNTYESVLAFFDLHKIPDKTVADCVEALLGVCFEAFGFKGALKLLEWLQVIPKTENIENLLNWPIPNPILKPTTAGQIDYLLPSWREVEKRLGYNFKNRAFLLQALTHSSFTANRITSCYQKLEFLGDAVLDFLVTCHIYETCDGLNPGELTDLRSALVNNITFAGFTVRCGFHKFLLYCNSHLGEVISNYVDYQESTGHSINSESLMLLQEDDLPLGEHVDVPKVLGDIFEALAGAVFLDSGLSLEIVWKVFYSIMWREVEAFKSNVPKNSVRLLYETIGSHPKFLQAVSVECGGMMVPLDFMLNGESKRVYGFGENKSIAKRAAAKVAVRLLQK